MEISSESMLEIWEMFSEHLPPAKRDQLALRFVKILMDHDVEISDIEDIRGEDEHLDHALEHLESLDDEDEDDDEEYYDE